MPRRPLVLVVEDDLVRRERYRIALVVANYDVQFCADGWSALAYLDEKRPDIVVVDLDPKPSRSGVGIYNALRAHVSSHEVPIVVCAESDEAPDFDGAIVLRQPCRPEQLIATVERTLRARERARLFIRGEESVRVVWEGDADRPTRLTVYGPGPATAVFNDTDSIGCVMRLTAVEQALLDEGYQKLPVFLGERRSGQDRRSTRRASSPDRRKPLTPAAPEPATGQ